MSEKPRKIPGPDHPITVTPNPARVVVTVAGRVVADSRNALTLREASYPPVQYIPRRDVDMEAPYDAVAAIKDHVAFYPDRVDSITEQPA
jgi:uncharacterized protein (DUF427 family)